MVAYLPLLTLLLPAKVALLAGEARVEWLGAATLAGAVAASIANVAFGWASDLRGTRRGWATVGLCLTIASLAPLHLAASPGGLVLAVILFQLALNLLLAPLTAWAADAVPPHRIGLLGGLLGAGAPIGAFAGVLATLPVLDEEWMRLGVLGALALLLTAPLLMMRAPERSVESKAEGRVRPGGRADLFLILIARFLAQVAGAVLFGYLFYYFQSLPGSPSQRDVARWSAASVTLAFPVALFLGRLSDRLGTRTPFLVAATVAAALGLTVMALRSGLTAAVAGYALFACANAVFLALLSSHAMRLLPAPGRRGRDLAVLNLGNTLPSIVAPLLAIGIVPSRGFAPLLAGLGVALIVAGACLLFVRKDEQAA